MAASVRVAWTHFETVEVWSYFLHAASRDVSGTTDTHSTLSDAMIGIVPVAIHTDTPPDPSARSPSTALSSSPRDNPRGRQKALALAPITDRRAAHLVVPLTKPHSELEDDGEKLVEELGGGVALNADGVHACAGGLELREEVLELAFGVVA